MQITQPAILDSNGKPVAGGDASGTTLANGDYLVDLGDALDLQSVHLEWDGTLVAAIKFFDSNRTTVNVSDSAGWAEETAMAAVNPAASAATKVVSNPGVKAAKIKATVHVTAQGKLLVLRRGGL